MDDLIKRLRDVQYEYYLKGDSDMYGILGKAATAIEDLLCKAEDAECCANIARNDYKSVRERNREPQDENEQLRKSVKDNPVKHGRWKVVQYFGDVSYYARCECGYEYRCGRRGYGNTAEIKPIFNNYCPNCGAKMDS